MIKIYMTRQTNTIQNFINSTRGHKKISIDIIEIRVRKIG